jgi:hypothetical protein
VCGRERERERELKEKVDMLREGKYEFVLRKGIRIMNKRKRIGTGIVKNQCILN